MADTKTGNAATSATPGKSDSWVSKHKTALIIAGVAGALLLVFLVLRSKKTSATASSANLGYYNPAQTQGSLSNLTGPQGPPGPRGPKGPPGPPGKKPPKPKHHHHHKPDTSKSKIPANQLTHAHITHLGGGVHTTSNFQQAPHHPKTGPPNRA
jgi:hypothetical protein